MQDDPAGGLDEDIGIDQAARLLEVGHEQVRAMADEGLLTPLAAFGEAEDLRFSRAEVLAARNLGG